MKGYKFYLMLVFLAVIVAIIILSPAKPKPEVCVIGEDGKTCTVATTINAPSEPGTYVYTTCVDFNENGNAGDEGECTSTTIEVRES